MIDAIIDTGPLVGALDRDDQWHAWATKQFAGIRQPALTCDAMISEACFLLRETPDSREKIFALIERDILHVVPVLPDESAAVRSLLVRYGQRMDYADACIVRLRIVQRIRPTSCAGATARLRPVSKCDRISVQRHGEGCCPQQ